MEFIRPANYVHPHRGLWAWGFPCAEWAGNRHHHCIARVSHMLDAIYLLIGAAFLGICALYAFACDNL